jgi:hypothetical protein
VDDDGYVVKYFSSRFPLVSVSLVVLTLSMGVGCSVGSALFQSKNLAFVADEAVFINEMHYDNNVTDAGGLLRVPTSRHFFG